MYDSNEINEERKEDEAEKNEKESVESTDKVEDNNKFIGDSLVHDGKTKILLVINAIIGTQK